MTTPSGMLDDPAMMVKRFASGTHGVIHAVLVAADGLAITASDGIDAEVVDRTAATASSLMALAHAMAREFGAGRPEILTFRTTRLHFLFMQIADRAGLAVLADRDANLGVVGHQMQRLVAAVGPRLQPAIRPAPVPYPAASRDR
jgi:predicted regulator of Ras-like GTPase activity (Roadblock/LC7/MglB family)